MTKAVIKKPTAKAPRPPKPKAKAKKDDSDSESDSEGEEEIEEFDSDKPQFNDLHMKAKIRETIVEAARKSGQKMAKINVSKIAAETKMSPYTLWKYYISAPNAICKTRKALVQATEKKTYRLLDELIPKYQEIALTNNLVLAQIIAQIKQEKQLEKAAITPVARSENSEKITKAPELEIEVDIPYQQVFERIQESFELTEDEEEIIHSLFKAYISLTACFKIRREIDLIEDGLKALKAQSVGGHAKPAVLSVQDRRKSYKNDADDLRKWLSQNPNLVRP